MWLTGDEGTYWESGPPTEVADVIDNSMPILYCKVVHKHITKDIVVANKCVHVGIWTRISYWLCLSRELIDDLHKGGFKINLGVNGSDFLIFTMVHFEKYFLGASPLPVLAGTINTAPADVGMSQKIVNSQIKLKSSGTVKHFMKKGLLFENGSEMNANIVLFATGYSDPHNSICDIVKLRVGKQLMPACGINNVSELCNY